MKRNFFKISAALVATSIIPVSTIACNNEKPKNKKNEIVFAMPQGQFYPLSIGIKPLVEYYNKTFKNETGFKPVKMQFAEDTKIWSEFELIKKIKENIALGNNDTLPNLVLGAQSGAYVLNQDRRLLDVSDQGINKSLFSTKIADLHSKLAGQNSKEDKIYSIPFDNSDVDSVVYNLDLLNLMLNLIKDGKGTIDENADIVIRARKAGVTGVGNDIPENSIWKALKLKTADAFKDLTINDETFQSIKSIRDLALAFHKGVQLDTAKINENTITGEVLSMDYEEDTFIKELHASLPKDKSIFDLDTSTGTFKVKYNLPNDNEVKEKFTKLWNDYEKSISVYKQEVKKNNKVFQSVKYMESSKVEWGSWNIREYKSAISFAASVGANQNKNTPFSKGYFGKKEPDKFEKMNARDEDVFMAPQLTVAQKGQQEIFHEGGSSLLGIDTQDAESNEATKMFLKWLYTGSNKIANLNVAEENWKTLAKTTGYIIPLKSVVNEVTANWFESEIKKLEKKIADSKTNTSIKIADNEISTLNYLRSSLLSIKSILKLESKDEKVIAKVNATDDKSKSIIDKISSSLYSRTVFNNPTTVSSEDMIKAFEDKIK